MQDFLVAETETYKRELLNLLAKSRGKFVLIQGDAVHSVWSTYEDAIQAAYAAFGLDKPFLVKKIEAIEHYFNSRSILPSCRQ
jgi:hypothetical protein